MTARGWSDLSDMLVLYEKHGLGVDEKLVAQYLQDPQIARSFAVYYDLWKKYKADYQVDTILAGSAASEIVSRAKNAKFDERLALLGLLLDAVMEKLRAVTRTELAQTELLGALKNSRLALSRSNSEPQTVLQAQIDTLEKRLRAGKKASTLPEDTEFALRSTIAVLRALQEQLAAERPETGSAAFALLKQDFDQRTAALKTQAAAAGRQLSNVFHFSEEAFGEGQELLILVTELTAGFYSARFISRYGCKEYFDHNKELLFYERQKGIIREIETWDLED